MSCGTSITCFASPSSDCRSSVTGFASIGSWATPTRDDDQSRKHSNNEEDQNVQVQKIPVTDCQNEETVS
jgi:hypothetical protein